jgi:hypothetical protein
MANGSNTTSSFGAFRQKLHGRDSRLPCSSHAGVWGCLAVGWRRARTGTTGDLGAWYGGAWRGGRVLRPQSASVNLSCPLTAGDGSE